MPQNFLDSQTPAQRQWWELKSQYYDVVLFFKMGKFYELFHMDVDLGVQELNLVYMKVSLVCIFLSYYVDFPCLKLKISITTGLIQLSFLGKVY